LDLSNLQSDYNFFQGMDGFAIPDHEQPMFSAGLSTTSIDWSHYDGLDFNNDDFAASSYSQAASFTGFDFSSIDQPALTTTSTSGDISEAEDYGLAPDIVGTRPALLQYGSDTSEFGGDVDSYRLSTASSYIGMPQVQMLAGNTVDSLGLEDFMKSDSNGFLPGVSASHDGLPLSIYPDEIKNSAADLYENENAFSMPLTEDSGAFWMNDFTTTNIATINDGNGLRDDNLWSQ